MRIVRIAYDERCSIRMFSFRNNPNARIAGWGNARVFSPRKG